MESIVKKYALKLDDQKRLIIRDSRFEYYQVQEFDDGTIVLQPKNSEDDISENTLKMMDKSMKNYEAGKTSPPIELEKYLTN